MRTLENMLETISVLWCRWFHTGITYGGGPSYECRICFRRYSVPWAERNERGAYYRG